MNHRKAQNVARAEERAAKLWKRYHENGDRITCAEVREITGRQKANLYDSFQSHGVSAPEPWDATKTQRKRTIDLLWKKAKELERDWLTVYDVSDALDIFPKNVYAVVRRLRDKIPEVRHQTKISAEINTEGLERTPILRAYTLKYYRKEPGPGENETTYYLK